jgi:RNA polymerase sigma-70 factor (ECF subfamily)
MPERTRAIFLDFRVHEIPQKEIADQHAISISAVEKHLQRAYRVIREYRNKMENDDAGGAGP